MRRPGGRIAKSARAHAGVPQRPWAPVRNPHPPLALLDEDQLNGLHGSTMRLLSEHGMKVLNAPARDRMKKAGALVDHDSGMVRTDESLIMAALKSAPERFDLVPRNRDRTLTMGSNAVNFGFVSGPPMVHCCLKGRRAGNMEDYRKLIRLAQHFNIIHMLGGQCCAPVDLPANTRHLDVYEADLLFTDKSFLASAISTLR